MATVWGVLGLESRIRLDKGVEGRRGLEAMVRMSEGLIKVKEESSAGEIATSVDRRRGMR